MLGRPLPPAQRDFLQTAAANLGFTVDKITFDLDEVTGLAEAKGETMPPHIFPLAVEEQPGIDYYLDTSRADRHGDGMVVSSPAGRLAFDETRPEYPSLRDMLFSRGFREIRMLTLPHRQWIDWELADFTDPKQAPRRDELHALLEKLGLRKLDVTSDARALYERGDCAAIVFQPMQFQSFAVFLAAAAPDVALLAAETLCDSMRGHGVRKPW